MYPYKFIGNTKVIEIKYYCTIQLLLILKIRALYGTWTNLKYKPQKTKT